MAVSLGLSLGLNEIGRIVVQSVNPNGAAAKTKIVRHGDVLQKVDGKFLLGANPATVKDLIPGDSGSTLTLTFLRESDTYDLHFVRTANGLLVPITGATAAQLAAIANGSSNSEKPLQKSSKPISTGSSDVLKPSSDIGKKQQPRELPTGSTANLSIQQAAPLSPKPVVQVKSFISEMPMKDAAGAVALQSKEQSKESSGVGLSISGDNYGRFQIVSLTEGGPAKACELIRVGDFLVAVDETPTIGKGIQDVRPLIVGPVGSSVVLRFQRPGVTESFSVKITRRPPKLSTMSTTSPSKPTKQVPAVRRPESARLSLPTTLPSDQSHREAVKMNGAPSRSSQEAPVIDDLRRRSDVSGRVLNGGSQVSESRKSMHLSQYEPLPASFLQSAYDERPPPEAPLVAELYTTAEGKIKMGGIGAVLNPLQGKAGYVIKSIVQGGPADICGELMVGDIVTEVDDRKITGMAFSSVKEIVQGPIGTTVDLLVTSKRHPLPRRVKVIRGFTSSGLAESKYGSNRQTIAAMSVRQSSANVDAVGELNECGVGIVVTNGKNDELIIQRIPRDGPAERSGRVAKNDIIRAINGKDVNAANMEMVRRLLLGPAGTPVRLTLERKANEAARRGQLIQVDLVRSSNAIR